MNIARRNLPTSVAVAAAFALLAGDHLARAGAPPGRFDTSSPNVAVDTVTGLRWQRAPSPPSGYATALSGCATLSLDGLSSGWRVPTIRELAGILDWRQTGSNVAVDPVAFPTVDTTHQLWSSTPNDATSTYRVWPLPTQVMISTVMNYATTLQTICVHDP